MDQEKTVAEKISTTASEILPATATVDDRSLTNGSTYTNPWDTWKFFSKQESVTWLWKYGIRKINTDEKITIFIGHASCLIQMEGLTILTDPIFSDRCSFSQWVGIKRYRKPACTVDELSEVNAVVISNNHYDHLDLNSVRDLNRKFGKKIHWFVPEGLKQWMMNEGCKNVTELSWWEKGSVENSAGNPVDFVFTPTQYWCQRGVFDRHKVLWGSWCIIGPSHRFFYAGDTGYYSVFKEIGLKYGPFNCAAIPIGAYHPRHFMKPQHVDPKEAVMIHQDVKSLQSYGIHWGTFKMSSEPYMEPKSLLTKSMTEQNLDPETFCTVHHGDVKIVENYV